MRLYFFGGDEIFAQIAWEFLFLTCAHVCLADEKSVQAARFFNRLESAMHTVNLIASDCRDMGQQVLTNLMRNLCHMPQAVLGSSLRDALRGLPAIICGAGPSLNRIIPKLAQLKDRALIIAGGTAVNALNNHGIIPHLVAHIDPHPPFRRFLQQEISETPFFYQHRFSHELLPKVHGQRVWVAGTGSYPIEEWMSSACGIESERRDSGWTVATFCTSLALELGCETLVLAGMDFACAPDETIYAAGVSGEEHENEFMTVQNEEGIEIFTKRDWLMSAEWLSATATAHPERKWLNASTGGIPIKGVATTDLSDELRQTFDVEAHLHAALAQATPSNVDQAKVDDVLSQLKKSFVRAADHVQQMFNLWQKHHPRPPLQSAEYALVEVEFEQEICFQYVLLPLWEIWKHPIVRKESHPIGKQLHRLLFFKNALDMNMRIFT